jgi:hypothetical protein
MGPIWLLDVDGVLNAHPTRPQLHVWSEDEWVQLPVYDSRGQRWTITAGVPVTRFLHKVHTHKFAEIVWLTTWQADANRVSDALGLPHFRVIENPIHKNTRYAGKDWWKLSEAFKVISSGRPVIWTDDDIGEEIRDLVHSYQVTSNTTRFLDIQVDVPGPTLLISPNGNEGLGPWHLKRISEFLQINSEREV